MSEQDPRSITAVMHGIVGNVEELVQAHVSLAKAELIEVLHQGARAARLLGVGVALGHIAVLLLLLAGASLLATRMPFWAAALIVGGAVGVVAIGFLVGGAGRLKDISPAPGATLATHRSTPHA